MSLYPDRTELREWTRTDDALSEPTVTSSPTLPEPAEPAEPAETASPAGSTAVPAHVGARLAEARAARGLDIDELSSRTYIRPSVLRRMEENDFAACGGACYARGQLRILAVALQLDGEELVSAFDRETDAFECATDVDEPQVQLTRSKPRHRKRSVARLGLLFLVILVIVATLAGLARIGSL